MANFKINRNKPDLPDEQINRHKDFGKLLNNHQKMMRYKDATRPLYKNPGFMSFIIVLSVVLLTYILTESDKKESDTRTDSIAAVTSASSVAPESAEEMQSDSSHPLVSESIVAGTGKDYQKPTVPFSSYKVDPKKGAVIYHKSTRILIAPMAFTDATGNPVLSQVDIRYREFRDPVDAWLAGIPMHYDSSGQAMNLESAGMFEIRGLSGQQAVYIKTPIKVEMATADHGSKFNTYFLDEKTKNWEYRGKENRSMRFMVQADEKEYPELKPFKDILWEFTINDQQKDLSPFRSIFSKTWSSFFVSEAAMLNSKDLKIKHNASESKFLAHPIPLLSDETANRRLMQAKFDEYYSLLKTKEKQQRDMEEAMRRQEEWLNSPHGKNYLQWAQSDNGQKQILSGRIVSIFSIAQFGTWNCDQPLHLPKGATLNALFTDQFDKKLELDEVYLIDYSINSTYKYYKGVSVQFNPKSSNVLWASLPGGEIAVYSKEKFKRLSKTSGKHTFKMEVIDINGKDANEVRKILEMKEHITAKAEAKEKDPVATYERVIQLKKAARENDVFYKKDDNLIYKETWKIADSTEAKKDLLKKK